MIKTKSTRVDHFAIRAREAEARQAAAVELTPEQQVEQNFEMFVKTIEMGLASAKKVIAAFAVKVVADPSYTLEWSSDAFTAAAKIRVLKTAQAYAEAAASDANSALTKENVVATLIKEFTRDVMREARFPSRSTSPVSNLMAQEFTSAKGQLIEDLNWLV